MYEIKNRKSAFDEDKRNIIRLRQLENSVQPGGMNIVIRCKLPPWKYTILKRYLSIEATEEPAFHPQNLAKMWLCQGIQMHDLWFSVLHRCQEAQMSIRWKQTLLGMFPNMSIVKINFETKISNFQVGIESIVPSSRALMLRNLCQPFLLKSWKSYALFFWVWERYFGLIFDIIGWKRKMLAENKWL